MKLPQGFTKDEIKEVIATWNKLHDEVDNGTFPIETFDYDQVYEDDEYIDRYMWIGDAEFCITTDKETNETYLSEIITLNKEESELFSIEELEEMVK